MNRTFKLAGGIVLALGLGAAAVAAVGHPGSHVNEGHDAMMQGMGPRGMGMGMGPTGMLTRQDAGSAADMNVVHDLVSASTKIRRSVTRLQDGISTLTESDDPAVAKSIQVHVASMSQRLQDGREFNLFSNSLPVLFANRDKIVSKVEMTAKGAAVTRTSADSKVVAALQAHSAEVTELVQDGMQAMRRGMMSRMAAGGIGGMRDMGGMGGMGGMQGMGGMNAMRGTGGMAGTPATGGAAEPHSHDH